MRLFTHLLVAFAALSVTGAELPPVAISAQTYQKPAEVHSAKVLVLRNAHVEIVLEPESPQVIRSLRDSVTGQDFIATESETPVPLYRLVSVAPDAALVEGNYARRVTDTRTGTLRQHAISREKDGTQRARLSYAHDDAAFEVVAEVSLAPEARHAEWTLQVKNRSGHAIVAVTYPGIAVPMVATSNPDATRILFPNSKHSFLFHDLPKEFQHYKGTAAWPFTLAWSEAPQTLPLIAYYTDRAGLYLGVHEPIGHIKTLRATGLSDRVVQLDLTHTRPWEHGRDFETGYAVRTEVFHGDWTAAADIYKAWATRQHWCAKGPLHLRKDIPGWMLAHSAWFRGYLTHPLGDGISTRQPLIPIEELLDPVKHKKHARGATPFQMIPETFEHGMPNRKIWERAEVNLVGWERMHWWGGYYDGHFPAWLGAENLRALVTALRERGAHVGAEPFGWRTIVQHPFGAEHYDLTQRHDWPHVWQNVLSWHEGFPKERPTRANQFPKIISLCPATDYGQTVFTRIAEELAPMGFDMIQIMEIDVLNHADCHNTGHGHPAGKGPWIIEAMRKAFASYREKGRALNPRFATQIEESHDMLIDLCDSYLDRNCIFGTGANSRFRYNPYHADVTENNVPLFNYVYHAYTTIYNPWEGGTNPVLNRYGAARATVLGSPTGYLHAGKPDTAAYRAALGSGAYDIQAEGLTALDRYARDFHVFGDTLPEPGVRAEGPSLTFKMSAPSPQGVWGSPANIIAGYNYRAQKLGAFSHENTAKTGPVFERTYNLPAIVQGAQRAPDGRVGLTFINIDQKPRRFTLTLDHLARYRRDANAPLRVTIYVDHQPQPEIALTRTESTPLTLQVEPGKLLFVVVNEG